ncbi:MAG: hypothetical protein AAFQ07_02855 [Chloroflexota bacterium]
MVAETIETPPRIHVEQDGDTVIVRLEAAAIWGRIVIALLLAGMIGVYTLIFTQPDTIADFTGDDTNIIFLIVPILVTVGVLISLMMRGFNTTVFRITPTELRRRTFPIGFTTKKIPREEIHSVSVRMERTSRTDRQEGINIRPFEIRVFDADNKPTVIKGSVRGRRHSQFICYKIAETYDLDVQHSLRERLLKLQSVNGFIKLIQD